MPQFILILDNIRSMHNVGAMFRLADGLGISELYLIGITATPPRAEIHKTALGAETHVKWKYFKAIDEAISQAKADNYTVAALELSDQAISLDQFKPTFPLALIVGHETEGVGERTLKSVDKIVQIPMHGHAHSLNVATATAIACWHLTQTSE